MQEQNRQMQALTRCTKFKGASSHGSSFNGPGTAANWLKKNALQFSRHARRHKHAEQMTQRCTYMLHFTGIRDAQMSLQSKDKSTTYYQKWMTEFWMLSRKALTCSTSQYPSCRST